MCSNKALLTKTVIWLSLSVNFCCPEASYSPDRKPPEYSGCCVGRAAGGGNPVCDGKALFDFSLSMFELLSVWLIK